MIAILRAWIAAVATAGIPALAATSNYSDIWWNPGESGWGLTIADHETQLFAVWYTYEASGDPVWFTIPGGTFSGDRRVFTGNVYSTTGPCDGASGFDAARVLATQRGTATIDFGPPDLPAGWARFSGSMGGVAWSKAVTRQPFGSSAALWGSDYTDIWWKPDESGWGVTLAQHGDNIFGIWFTYACDGRPLFATLPGVTFSGAAAFRADLYTTRSAGPWWGSPAFDSRLVTATRAGTATVSFQGRTGRFEPSLGEARRARSIEAQPFGAAGPPAIDAAVLAQWERQMTAKGRQNCDQIARNLADAMVDFDHKLIDVYYDGAKVYYQIADYTKGSDPASQAYWNACAATANHVYRDLYVLDRAPCDGGGFGCVAGYWNFITGMRMHFERTSDPVSKQTALLVAQHAAFASDAEPVSGSVTAERSREVAYAIRSYLDAELLGRPRRARLAAMVDNALGHIDQWFVSKNYRCPSDCDPQAAVGQYYIQPFMVGLTCEALIRYHARTGDARVLPAVKTALDAIWDLAWLPAAGAFWYDDWAADPSLPFPPPESHGADRGAAPSLNLLIAPGFAWVYHQTGDAKYRDRGDQIFAGGVRDAFLDGGKAFDQNYFWSFDYLAWRQPAVH